ncbi:MAG: SH3 domain-containing protein [Cyanobacteriota bacterium]|nr:SH3 domain-containing protein [Cyanobacteriota bacterium]
MPYPFPWRPLRLATLTLLALSPVPGLAAGPGLQPPEVNPPALWLAQAGTAETVLFFETETLAVRIYRRDQALFMNLYDKTINAVVLRAPAELVPSTRDQTVYKNSVGEGERFARINVANETELEIRGGDGSLVRREAGFNTVVGVPNGPTNFQGNNFAPGTGAIVLSSQAARLRSHPRLGSDMVGEVNRREVVQVIDRVGNPEDGFLWYQVTYRDLRGWVRGDLLKPV